MARRIEILKGDFIIKEKVEVVYEKTITPFGNSEKLDAPKKYRVESVRRHSKRLIILVPQPRESKDIYTPTPLSLALMDAAWKGNGLRV
jgi:putative transposon-encoded protein